MTPLLPKTVDIFTPRYGARRAAGTVALLACLLLLRTGSASQPGQQPAPQIGAQVRPFSLDDCWGKTYRLDDFDDSRVVVLAFLGTECPLARLYGPRLADLARRYEGQGVQFLGLNSNCQDSLAEIAAYVRRSKIEFPVLRDVKNVVADQLGAIRTPEVFVLDDARRIRYWGRIDDQYGVGYVRESPTRLDLKVAIDQLLQGEPVARRVTDSVGCRIGRVPRPNPDASVTYSRQIVRIFQKHCVECHRAGQIAPFALTDYDEAAGWAETIAEVIRDGRMPPWHASPESDSFVNARVMDEQEKQLVYQWVAEGAPEGDREQLPEPRAFVEGWRLPRLPDLVLPMRERPFQVPAQGIIQYQYFVVDPGFQQDTWVAAAEVRPGNRRVVHHAIVFVRPPDGYDQDGVGWLTAYVPGNARVDLPDGYARLIPAGSKLVFQMHYTPVGTVESDVTELGLVLTDERQVRKKVMTLIALERDFEIPPFAANYRVETTLSGLPEQCELLALGPHMHLRGKAFQFYAEYPGQPPVKLLDVPNYDFNWQHVYQWQRPMETSPELRIRCVAHFDNSEENLVNPDPAARVRWGDQTWEEMVLGYLEVAVPADNADRQLRLRARQAARRQAAAEAKARRFLSRLDRDGDGHVSRDEAPETLRVFAFRELDADRDGRITLAEAVASSLDAD